MLARRRSSSGSMASQSTQSRRRWDSISKHWSIKVSMSHNLSRYLLIQSDSGYTLNLWDVGGQKSLRSYWRNYFESTDGLVWVVDSADRMRLDACREELNILLLEERLAGATLLVLANKQDLPGALSAQEIKDVSCAPSNTLKAQLTVPINRFSNLTTSRVITGRWWASALSRVINY